MVKYKLGLSILSFILSDSMRIAQSQFLLFSHSRNFGKVIELGLVSDSTDSIVQICVHVQNINIVHTVLHVSHTVLHTTHY